MSNIGENDIRKDASITLTDLQLIVEPRNKDKQIFDIESIDEYEIRNETKEVHGPQLPYFKQTVLTGRSFITIKLTVSKESKNNEKKIN